MTRRPQLPRRCQLVPAICTPKALVVIALVFWNSGLGSADHSHKIPKVRSPPSYLPQRSALLRPRPFESTGEKRIGFSLNRPSDHPPSEEQGIIGPFVGNIAEDADGDFESPKRKKDCGGMPPSIATRGLVGPTLKRAFLAATKEEMENKLREQQEEERTREKREVNNEPSLPWTCETKYDWHDMGADHYPRFVRTAECKTRSCFNGFFRCRPRRYKTKVLKRVSPSDSTSCEDEDVSLPESLRSQWKFITVTISLCCDCVGRIPGTVET